MTHVAVSRTPMPASAKDSVMHRNAASQQRDAALTLASWVRTAPTGSTYLTRDGTLYLMCQFNHRKIDDAEIREALLQRERFLVQKTLRSQRVIRGLFGYSLLTTILLTVGTFLLW